MNTENPQRKQDRDRSDTHFDLYAPTSPIAFYLIYPNTLSLADATSLRTTLAPRNTILHPIPQNLVDKIWIARPPRPAEPILPLALEYAGVGAKEKLEMVRGKIAKARAAGLVVSLLDEVAWLVGMRGGDIDYNPGTLLPSHSQRRKENLTQCKF